MFLAAFAVVVVLYVGWSYLLYRFHHDAAAIDPAIITKAGKPSLFWTAFNRRAELVRLMRRRDLADSRFAPLVGQARVLQLWALCFVASLVWLAWVSWSDGLVFQ